MDIKNELQIELCSGSKLNFTRKDLFSVRVDGIEMIPKQKGDKIITSTQKKDRRSRGQPTFFMFRNTMRMIHPMAQKNKNRETSFSKIEYDCIIKAFYEKMDPVGRLRLKANSPKEIGISPPKIGAVKHFLIKMSVLESGSNTRTCYGDKKVFIQGAEKAWKILQEKEYLE